MAGTSPAMTARVSNRRWTIPACTSKPLRSHRCPAAHPKAPHPPRPARPQPRSPPARHQERHPPQPGPPARDHLRHRPSARRARRATHADRLRRAIRPRRPPRPQVTSTVPKEQDRQSRNVIPTATRDCSLTRQPGHRELFNYNETPSSRCSSSRDPYRCCRETGLLGHPLS